MFYEVGLSCENRAIAAEGSVSWHAFRACPELVEGRAERLTKSSPPLAAVGTPGPWDTFSTRTLGHRINRRMAREFNGDSQKIREASAAAVSRALEIDASRWSSVQRQALENWSLILVLIPGLARWSPNEKRQLVKIIRAKSAPDEMPYLRQTQRDSRLRDELLRLGSR
jgi:hypothetical protein